MSLAETRALIEAMNAEPEDGPYWKPDAEFGRVFEWSRWVDESFRPDWERHHPPKLCIDGHEYRRRSRRR